MTSPIRITTTTATADEYLDLPAELPCHTTELLQRLDAPIRRVIDQVLAHGWRSRRVSPVCLVLDVRPGDDVQQVERIVDRLTKTVWTPIGAWRDPWDLARSIAYNARVRGLSRWCVVAFVEVVLGKYLDDQEHLWNAVRGGRYLAEQHASQALDVEVVRVSVKRAQHAGASWTARVYARPRTPATAMPNEISYACTVLDEDEQPTAELLALLDTFGADGGPVIDLAREHVLVLQKYSRLDGRRARAITRDDQSQATHLLRLDGY
jgi:hypothetical protein